MEAQEINVSSLVRDLKMMMIKIHNILNMTLNAEAYLLSIEKILIIDILFYTTTYKMLKLANNFVEHVEEDVCCLVTFKPN